MILKLKRTPGIFVVGFMGSGKSTIGAELAKALEWTFADLDNDIEAAADVAIRDIFRDKGEEEFRRLETAALEARLKEVRAGKPRVIALGGGAFIQPRNRALIAACGISVWLDCPLEVIERRVAGSPGRPLAQDLEAFRNLYETRHPVYALADYAIPITSDDPAVAVRQIIGIPGLFE